MCGDVPTGLAIGASRGYTKQGDKSGSDTVLAVVIAAVVIKVVAFIFVIYPLEPTADALKVEGFGMLAFNASEKAQFDNKKVEGWVDFFHNESK